MKEKKDATEKKNAKKKKDAAEEIGNVTAISATAQEKKQERQGERTEKHRPHGRIIHPCPDATGINVIATKL